jgi:hypothetical protein
MKEITAVQVNGRDGNATFHNGTCTWLVQENTYFEARKEYTTNSVA